MPEALVAGRQEIYFRYLFGIGTHGNSGMDDADVTHYANAYANPAQLHAAFEMYRAFSANIEFNAAQHERSDVPLFVAAGEGSPFATIIPTMAEDLRSKGFANVEFGLVPGSVHYILQDQPDAVADLVERYASP